MTNASRAVKYAKRSSRNIADNELFAFSRGHALSVYPCDAIYTYIPKNACSTMRFSVAMANGYVDDISQLDWIHGNNLTFIASLKELATCHYTFIVLRCPFRRLASVYVDKLARREFEVRGGEAGQAPMSFGDFVRFVCSQPTEAMNQHWRPQIDFLFYDRYDDYFSLEDFARAERDLARRGLVVHDTRAVIGHDSSHLQRIDGAFSALRIDEVAAMRAAGSVPSYASLYTDELAHLVAAKFGDDVELYAERFGPGNLLFDIRPVAADHRRGAA